MSLPPKYFEDLYEQSADPWGFVDRWYERRKRALTLALLPDARYGTAYEPGCSIGVFTRDLAMRCDHLLCSDVSPQAVQAARARTADLPNVTVVQAHLPAAWPAAVFDLVVASEIGYYFSSLDARVFADRACAAATTVLALHWRHSVADYPIGGDDVHIIFRAAAGAAGLQHLSRYLDEDIVADVWKRDAQSVGAREGLT